MLLTRSNIYVSRESMFCFFFSNFTRDFIIENKEMKNRNKCILRIIFIFRNNIF